jgi:hypothetical protein
MYFNYFMRQIYIKDIECTSKQETKYAYIDN